MISKNKQNKEELKVDTRLSGTAAEYILSCLLRNKYQIFAQRFDVEGFDIIAFDRENQIFKGKSPLFIHVRTRGGGEPTGISLREHEDVRKLAHQLTIPLESIYLAFGSFAEDIRKIRFYIIPWEKIPQFCSSKKGRSYRFRIKQLEKLAQERTDVIKMDSP